MFDDECMTFLLSFFLSFLVKQLSIRVYFFFDSFFLCCTDVKLRMLYKLNEITIKLILKIETPNRLV